MTRRRGGFALVRAFLVLALLSGAPVAQAETGPPAAGDPCPVELDGAMTQLPGGPEYLVCSAPVWTPVPIPFPPNGTWLSYGPAITLHGQGFRNPNLTSGPWTATPLDDDTRCGATQVTVIEPGVLAPPVVTEADPQSPSGQPLNLEVLPKLFTIELTGHCRWAAANAWLMP